MIALPVETVVDAQGHMIEAHVDTFRTLDGVEHEWVADFIEEHTAFPKGANDDWVDCTVHGLTYYTRPHGEDDYSEVAVYETDVTVSSELDAIDSGGF